MVVDPLGDEKLRLFRPSIAALGKTDLLVAERFAMGLGGILLVRGTVTDVAVNHDEGGTAIRILEYLKSLLDTINVVGIPHPQNVPPIAQEPSSDVLCKGNSGAPLNGDVVVVVDPAEIVQT